MGKGILAGASGGGTNIPVTSDPADNVQIWIDPNEEDQNEQFYTKTETENYVKITAALKDLSNVDSAALLAAIESAGGGGAKIEFGSYVGTGKYGSANPNTLTFSFAPKYFYIPIIVSGTNGMYTSGKTSLPGSNCITHVFTDWIKTTKTVGYWWWQPTLDSTWIKSEDGKTISWYSSTNETHQGNTSGSVYYYIAIG